MKQVDVNNTHHDLFIKKDWEIKFFQATFPARLQHNYGAVHQAEYFWGQSLVPQQKSPPK